MHVLMCTYGSRDAGSPTWHQDVHAWAQRVQVHARTAIAVGRTRLGLRTDSIRVACARRNCLALGSRVARALMVIVCRELHARASERQLWTDSRVQCASTCRGTDACVHKRCDHHLCQSGPCSPQCAPGDGRQQRAMHRQCQVGTRLVPVCVEAGAYLEVTVGGRGVGQHVAHRHRTLADLGGWGAADLCRCLGLHSLEAGFRATRLVAGCAEQQCDSCLGTFQDVHTGMRR